MKVSEPLDNNLFGYKVQSFSGQAAKLLAHFPELLSHCIILSLGLNILYSTVGEISPTQAFNALLECTV